MRGALVALALVACTGEPRTDAVDTGAHNGVSVRMVVDEVPATLFDLTVSVEQVVLEGDGPQGHEAVSYDARTDLDLVGGTAGAPIVLDLDVGRWEDVDLAVTLGATDAGPALFAAGRVGERRFELSVEPELALEDHGGFELQAGLDPMLDVVLRPSEWLDDLDEEELEDTSGVYLVDLAHNREVYDKVVDRIVKSTEARFPGEEEARDTSR
ncbi:MAG: hypothetical protein H6738_01365 [Alphaproteobacteria bacterium]|nr:hypothetical protein [Alphaproteobacteria bacterium]MCB9695416.1 hypothetical protein [Alphaproteobacteria bacterium]